MATLKVSEYSGVPLSVAQTGNGASTNIADRGTVSVGPGWVVIASTVGATPTVAVDIQGSLDAADWWVIPYAALTAPETPVVTSPAVTITTATTNRFLLRPGHPWRYMRLLYSANTNVTLTATLYVAGAM
jgi:hypothetical protein